MALIDLFLRAHWAQKILFLADRDALVEQALNDGFKAHLPNEPRVRIHTAKIDPDKRLSASTRPRPAFSGAASTAWTSARKTATPSSSRALTPTRLTTPAPISKCCPTFFRSPTPVDAKEEHH
jgi:hypothetical protein